MSKKQTEQAPIAADEVLSKSEEIVLKYKKMIGVGLFAIIVIVAGIIIVNKYVIEPAEKEAAEVLFPAQQLFNAGSFEEALNGDGTNLGLIAFIDEYGSTKSGEIANAYAGMALAQLGRYEEAIPYLKAFDGDDQIVAPAALGTLGNCYAQTGDKENAIKYFLEAASEASNYTVSPHYLLQAGIIYEQMGEPKKALGLYEEIKAKYPMYNNADINKYINRVK